MPELTITEADVDSFRRKLDDWATTLSDAEQAILAMVSTRAFPEVDDVQGFAGKGAVHDFHFVKMVDQSSPKLFAAADLGSMVGIHVSFGAPSGELS